MGWGEKNNNSIDAHNQARCCIFITNTRIKGHYLPLFLAVTSQVSDITSWAIVLSFKHTITFTFLKPKDILFLTFYSIFTLLKNSGNAWKQIAVHRSQHHLVCRWKHIILSGIVWGDSYPRQSVCLKFTATWVSFDTWIYAVSQYQNGYVFVKMIHYMSADPEWNRLIIKYFLMTCYTVYCNSTI